MCTAVSAIHRSFRSSHGPHGAARAQMMHGLPPMNVWQRRARGRGGEPPVPPSVPGTRTVRRTRGGLRPTKARRSHPAPPVKSPTLGMFFWHGDIGLPTSEDTRAHTRTGWLPGSSGPKGATCQAYAQRARACVCACVCVHVFARPTCVRVCCSV